MGSIIPLGCQGHECGRLATMAVRTTGIRTLVKSVVYWDLDDAPSTAEPLCRKCGRETLTELANLLVPCDDDDQ